MFKGGEAHYTLEDLQPSSPADLALDVLDPVGKGWLAAHIRGPTLHVVTLQASRRDVTDAAADSAAPGRGRTTGGSAE